MIDNREEGILEKALLIAIDTGEYDIDDSIDELKELAKTAGAETLGVIIQKRKSPDSATCIGQGRLDEAALFVKNAQIELVIFDCELSGSQLKNISDVLDCNVVDRTMLILDIFAARARSAEGRLQVELAQQRYRLPRIMGQGAALSRLGGGIGTRGPGETKLESDRRHIRRRIAALREELDEVSKRRTLHRQRRKKDEITTIAIVGYTNVGKSTLINKLTDSDILAENMLFATLDTTARGIALPDGRQVMLVDTVGFIRRLPHMLVDAFRSTLEEAVFSDLILNVCDISSPDAKDQLDVTTALLQELGAGEIPVITVLNKCDKISESPIALNDDICPISAKTGFGLDILLEKISSALTPTHTKLTLLLPYSEGSLTGELRAGGRVINEEFTPEGIVMELYAENRLLHRCSKYIVEK